MELTLSEDHTLGNLLQQNLALRPEIKFVGYIMPNPHEKIIKIKIETYEPGLEKKIILETIDEILKFLKDLENEFSTAPR